MTNPPITARHNVHEDSPETIGESSGWKPSGAAAVAVDPADDGEIFVDEATPWIPVILSPTVLYPTGGVALAAAIGIGALNSSRGPVTATALALLAASLVFLAVIDARTLRLPNPIVFSLYGVMAVGAAVGLAAGEVTLSGVMIALASMAGAFTFWWLVAFTMGGVGYGDIKLAGVMGLGIGLIGPWSAGFGTILLPTLIGGAVSLALVTIGKRDLAIPFGPFLAAGGIIIMALPGQIFTGLV